MIFLSDSGETEETDMGDNISTDLGKPVSGFGRTLFFAGFGASGFGRAFLLDFMPLASEEFFDGFGVLGFGRTLVLLDLGHRYLSDLGET